MKRYQLIAALAAFIITFILCMALKNCTVKAEAKTKDGKSKTEKNEAEVIEGAKPLAGLSLVLKKVAERNVDVVKILRQWWQQEQEKKKQEQEDINLLAEVIYWENWYTDKKKKTARWTGAVVMNRVKSKKFPNTVKDVLYQTKPCIQYSTTEYFFTKKLPQEVYEMAKDIYRNGTPEVPENVLYQATFYQGELWKECNGEKFCYG